MTAETAEQPKRRGKIRASYKDLNSRGRGSKHYRMAIDGDVLVWIDKHPDCIGDGNRLSSDDFRAAGRKDSTHIEVPEGIIVIEINKQVPTGSTSYDAGRTYFDETAGKMAVRWNDDVKHIGVKKTTTGGFVHVIEIDGVRKEVSSP
jgi:hypothetical protein